MTADELLAIARRDKPHVRYTKNRSGTAIAAFRDGRWNTVAMLLIPVERGQWGSVGDLLINGEPCNPQSEWIDDKEPELCR